MNIRWHERATRVSEGDVVHEPWNLSTVSTGSITPLPRTPAPFYRRLLLTRTAILGEMKVETEIVE